MARGIGVVAASLMLFVGAPLCAVASPAGSATKPDPRAWPAVYQPSDTTVGDVLARTDAAYGTKTARTDNVRTTYAIHSRNLDGIETDVERGDDYRIVLALGPVHSEHGRFHGRNWAQDETGYTRMFRGYHQSNDADALALDKANPDIVHLAGRISAPCDCIVLIVGPQTRPRQRRFYEAATYHLVRVEKRALGRLAVISYDDFRSQNGITFAWHQTVDDGRPDNLVTFATTSFDNLTAIPDADLTIPVTRSPISFPAGVDRVRLPARIERGRIIVRIDIAGRGLDFLIDSGADGIIIDRDIAAKLKLPTLEHRANDTTGPSTGSTIMLPHVTIGDLGLDNAVATAAPFRLSHDYNTEIVGLLGYDFIAGCVLRVDYAGGTVEALRPATFTVPANAVILDAALDDAVPTVTMVLNGVVGRNFVVDTGDTYTLIFPPFADAHPDSVKDASAAEYVSRDNTEVVDDGVGGSLTFRALLIHDIAFGNVHFTDNLAAVISSGGRSTAFAGEDFDGYIGTTLLAPFAVSFDYAHERVLLEPGAGVTFRPGKTPR